MGKEAGNSVMVTIDLSEQLALVTGASRGLGAAILETLCAAGAVGLLNHLEDAGGVNREEVIVHVHQGQDLGVFSDRGFGENGGEERT